MIRLKDILTEQSEIALPRVSVTNGKIQMQDLHTKKVYIFQLHVWKTVTWLNIEVNSIHINKTNLDDSTITVKHPITGNKLVNPLSRDTIVDISKQYNTNKEFRFTTKNEDELKLTLTNSW